MTAGTFPSDQLRRGRDQQIDQHLRSYDSYSCCDERLLPPKLVSAASPTIESWRCDRPKLARQQS
jgi:hypothetical protein